MEEVLVIHLQSMTLGEKIHKISATNIRKDMRNKGELKEK